MRLVLASSSPRRIDFCRALGLDFVSVAPDVDETLPAEIEPAVAVRGLATAKAQAVFDRYADAIVIAADTLVALDGEILGKPLDRTEAANMLRRLAGREHTVFTGLVVASSGECQPEVVVQTQVRFRDLTETNIDAYVSSGDPLDKAGAYGIQGPGAALISETTGCFSSVAGLPVCQLSRILTLLGAMPSMVVCGTGLDVPPASIVQRSPLR
jgi:septum formation protein